MKLFEKQVSLPNLPVPKLEQSLALYLASVEPLLSSDEFSKTKSLCQDFMKPDGVGENLQTLLLAKAKECEKNRGKVNKDAASDEFSHPDGSLYPNNHWLENWWETYAYLSDKAPLATYVNCWQSNFSSLPCSKPLTRIAWVILGSLDFKRLLENEDIPPEGAGKTTFCSAQYHRIIGTTRIPGKECDRMMTARNSKHICIERRGYWYKVDHVERYSPSQLEQVLTMIKQDADSRPYGPGVAAFTGVERDVWANNRENLQSFSPKNAASLHDMEYALFLVILSEASPNTNDELQNYGAYGNGTQVWFDKAVTIISCENGRVISNLEHASADAVVPARMYMYVDEFVHKNCQEVGFDKSIPYKEGVAQMKISEYTKQEDPTVKPTFDRVDFALNDELNQALDQSKARLQELIEDHVITCLKFEDFGAKTLREKCKGISSDSFIQMSLALAYYRDQNGEIPASYETATTRTFFHSRTETIRSQSKYSKAFCEGFSQPDFDQKKLADLIRAAGNHHRNYLRACMGGQGCDRHLMGLKIIGLENGIEHPIFQDPAYSHSTDFSLSTSQMPWAIESYPAFGAYSPHAYGVCYRLTNCDTIVATVTSRNSKEKNAIRFRDAIYQAFRDIFKVLVDHPPPPKTKKPKANL